MLNIFFCMLNVALSLILWEFKEKRNFKVASITFDAEKVLLVLSCIVLIWGIARLARTLRVFSNLLANKVMIVMHIVADLFIIVVNIVKNAVDYKSGLRAFGITNICSFVIYFLHSDIVPL